VDLFLVFVERGEEVTDTNWYIYRLKWEDDGERKLSLVAGTCKPYLLFWTGYTTA